MNNNSQISSNLTRRLKSMNLRFWGGWFLAIACVCIFLTMGCESGSLGVKEATVSGRVVNKDNVAQGVPNVTVRMVSKEAVSSGGDLEQGYNFRSTVTDADGYFIFEKVHPDNVVFEFTAPSYKKVVFPATSDTEEADGTTSEKLDIDSVAISNGAYVDLMNVFMEKISITLPDNVTVKLDIVDSITKERVKDSEKFSVSFDGVENDDPMTPSAWFARGMEVKSSNQILMSVRNEENGGKTLYEPTSMTISGVSNQIITVEVKPVTYNLAFQFLNVPQYILSSKNTTPVLSLLVEYYNDNQGPAQSISVTPVTDFGQLAVLEVPAVRNPQQIRLRMQGYYDEVISLNAELSEGIKGIYRIDVDFDYEDGHYAVGENDNPITGSELRGRVGMKDNVKRTDIVVNMIGLAPGEKASIVTNFIPENGIQWSLPNDNNIRGVANELGQTTATLQGCPTYFDMTYTISVFPTSNASSSYIISSGDKTIPISVPQLKTGSQLEYEPIEFTIDVSKAEKSSTSN